MNLNDDEINEFNYHYSRATEMMKGIIILDEYRPGNLNFFEKRRARKSIKYFENALAIVPNNFASLFFLGKIYQRLKEYEKSLFYFEEGLEFEKENYSLPQEASLVAMHLNLIDKAIEYSSEALNRNPDNYGLMGNHAMNLLIGGKDQEATKIIENALKLAPKDVVNNNIQKKILEVISGIINRPTFKQSI
jgi:tetratricopeptide (TPR) repeat protein